MNTKIAAEKVETGMTVVSVDGFEYRVAKATTAPGQRFTKIVLALGPNDARTSVKIARDTLVTVKGV